MQIPMLNRCGCLAAALLLSACSSTSVQQDSAPSRSVDVSQLPDAVPTVVTRTRAGNKSPYTVLGKTYTVMDDAKGFRQSGTASWYGTKFHGRLTSNGEIYDMFAMTAAHKSIPIPSYARVTNQANGVSVVVRVNDRGPFHGDRIIDLSYAAAKKLGYSDLGTAEVRVEVITPPGQGVSGPVSVPSGDAPAAPLDSYSLPKNTYLQAGAFSSKSAAEALRVKIAALIQEPVRVLPQRGLFKVQVGPVASSQAMLEVRQTLGEKNLSSLHVVYD